MALSRRWTRRALLLLLLLVTLAITFSGAHAAQHLHDAAPVWPRPRFDGGAASDAQRFANWQWRRTTGNPPLLAQISDFVLEMDGPARVIATVAML